MRWAVIVGGHLDAGTVTAEMVELKALWDRPHK